MISQTERNLQYLYARIAGFSYIVFTVAGLIKNFLLNTKLSDVDAIQANGILENEMHFRLGIWLLTMGINIPIDGDSHST